MGLPALNNQNTVGELGIDAQNVSQSILTSMVRSGRITLVNNGAVNFNSSINVTGTRTATRESGSFMEQRISNGLAEIRYALLAMNNNLNRFVETISTQNQVSENLSETKQIKDYQVNEKYTLYDLALSFRQDFKTFSKEITNELKGITGSGGFGGGLVAGVAGAGAMGGILNFLKGAFPIIMRVLPWAAGAAAVAYLFGETELGKSLKTKAESLIKGAESSFDGLSDPEPEPGEGTASNQQTPNAPATPSSPTATPSSAPTTATPQPQTNAGGAGNATAAPATRVRTLPNPIRTSSGGVEGLEFAHPEQKAIQTEIASIALALQQKLGKKLFILSGYRSKEHNDALIKRGIKAAKDSAHIRGNAVDIRWSGNRHLSKEDMIKIIPLASAFGAKGIGIYPTQGFIHLDTERRRYWSDPLPVPDWAAPLLVKHKNNGYIGGYELEDDKKSTIDTKSHDPEPEPNASIPNATKPEDTSKTSPSGPTPTTLNELIKSNGPAYTGMSIFGGFGGGEEKKEAPTATKSSASTTNTNTQRTKETATKTPRGSSSDNKYKIILNYISASEGTDKYGYDTSFGGSYKPLTKMPIKEVRALQHSYSKKYGSSAMGKYQIMGDEIDNGLASGLIKSTDLFDAETQDKMAIHQFLKKRAQVDDWFSGKISNKEFGHNLSKIWAGIPDPYLGSQVSHYKNKKVGGKEQRARYNTDVLYANLDKAKSGSDTMLADKSEGGSAKPAEAPTSPPPFFGTGDTIGEKVEAGIKSAGAYGMVEVDAAMKELRSLSKGAQEEVVSMVRQAREISKSNKGQSSIAKAVKGIQEEASEVVDQAREIGESATQEEQRQKEINLEQQKESGQSATPKQEDETTSWMNYLPESITEMNKQPETGDFISKGTTSINQSKEQLMMSNNESTDIQPQTRNSVPAIPTRTPNSGKNVGTAGSTGLDLGVRNEEPRFLLATIGSFVNFFR